MTRPEMVHRRLVVMNQEPGTHQKVQFFQRLEGPALHRTVKDYILDAEITDIRLLPVYAYHRRIGCHYLLVQQIPFQVSNNFLHCS